RTLGVCQAESRVTERKGLPITSRVKSARACPRAANAAALNLWLPADKTSDAVLRGSPLVPPRAMAALAAAALVIALRFVASVAAAKQASVACRQAAILTKPSATRSLNSTACRLRASVKRLQIWRQNALASNSPFRRL